MQFRKCVWILLGVAMVLPNSILNAQTAGATISGVVRDASAAVIPGAKVTITNADTGIARSTVTDAGGRYEVPGLIPGHYEVQAEMSGFQTEIRKGLQLTVGSEIAIPLVLTVGQVAQTTVVTAEAPMIETASSTLAGLVDDRTIRDLPLNGRSFDQLIVLESSAPQFRSRGANIGAGMGAGFSVNGAWTSSNTYLMDGVELLGANTSSSAPGGVLGKNMGVDAIQEFQVLTGNYSAAYGKRAGGVINIATRSGTNQLHGSALEFIRNDNFDARSFFDNTPQPPEFRRNQFGGTVGGPIRKDRTFFFGNYEGLREALGLTNIAIVPDSNARLSAVPSIKPYVDLLPLPNGRVFGDGTAEVLTNPAQISSEDFFMVRMDHKISDKDFLMGRYNFSKSTALQPAIVPIFADSLGSRDQVAMLEWKRSYATTLNSLRFGFTRGVTTTDSLPQTVAAGDPSLGFFTGAKYIGIVSFAAGVGGGGGASLSGFGTTMQYGRHTTVNQFDTSDQIFRQVGPHSLNFGMQFQRIQHNEDKSQFKLGQFQFPSLAGFLAGKPTTFQSVNPALPGNDANKGWRQIFLSGYIQDDIKLRPNFTLNLGLRYELLTVPVEVNNRISNYRPEVLNGLRIVETTPHLGSPFFKSNPDIFMPRIGLAWDVRGNGKTAIRGGFGFFYDELESVYRYSTQANPPYFGAYTITNPTSFPLGFSSSTGTLPVPAPDGIDYNLQVPTRLQWNLSAQQQIASNTALTIGYVGARSYHVTRISDGNSAVPQILPGDIKFYPTPNPLRNPALGGIRLTTTDGNARYNALQMDVTQRLNRGLRAKVSFTFANSIDDVSSIDSGFSTGTAYVTQDPENTRRDRGLSASALRRNLVMNFTYDLPWNHFTGTAGKLIGGWQVGAIATVADGTPFTALTGFNLSRDRQRTVADRPNLKAGASNNPVLGGPDKYYDPNAFELPLPGFYGNLGRNTLIGPGFRVVDFPLVKTTTLNERFKLDFRAEFFNLFNHANFALPNASVFNSNGTVQAAAGRITKLVSTSRQIQFGVKLSF